MSTYPALVFLYSLLAYGSAKNKLSNIVLGVFALTFVLICISASAPWLVNCGEMGLSFVCIIKALARCDYPSQSILKSRAMLIFVIVTGILATSLPLLNEMKRSGMFGQDKKAQPGLCSVDGNLCSGTLAEGVSVSDLQGKVRAACDCMHGEGTYEKSQVRQTETDSAYCFYLSLPSGTNVVINVMKKDGRVVSFVEGSHSKVVQGSK